MKSQMIEISNNKIQCIKINGRESTLVSLGNKAINIYTRNYKRKILLNAFRRLGKTIKGNKWRPGINKLQSRKRGISKLKNLVLISLTKPLILEIKLKIRMEDYTVFLELPWWLKW